jgi:hypothetical protein
VDCCAFLAWELASRETAIVFGSQGIRFRLPEEADIYTILKYLALVYPRGGGAVEGPLEDSNYKVIFTPSAERFFEAGWAGARVLGRHEIGSAAAAV